VADCVIGRWNERLPGVPGTQGHAEVTEVIGGGHSLWPSHSLPCRLQLDLQCRHWPVDDIIDDVIIWRHAHRLTTHVVSLVPYTRNVCFTVNWTRV